MGFDWIAEVESLNKLFVVDLVLRVDWENSNDLDKFIQGQWDADFCQNILELSLVDESSSFTVIETKLVEQIVFKYLVIDHFPLDSSYEFLLPFLIDRNFLIFNTAYVQDVDNNLDRDFCPAFANIAA